ncbi:MAG: hypothetical protein Athens041674_327 [Parcubacteria group bacterium Athens0416_74]|nr:MAG: hypothetical protein Athens041674_327 [Parcubacteria group bacterium Athens0416_74]
MPSILIFLSAFFLPSLVFAHEVYVLPLDVIQAAMANPSPDPFSAIAGNELKFFFWAFVGFVVVSTIAAATFFGAMEKRMLPTLMRLKRYALPLARLTAGLSTLSFGLMGALYGTEIPFDSLFGGVTMLMQIFFVIAGAALTLGIFTRPFALLLALVYAWAGYIYGWYIFTYTDHIGLYILLLLLGSGGYSLSRALHINEMNAPRIIEHLRPLAFPILRILFGFGIMFASIYAKYMYSALALNVVTMYSLTTYFPFDPLFVVLGALIIEFLAGVLFMLGIAVRWSSLFLLFWLSLSLIYFQEDVWPHIILFGLCGVVFLHGYDKFSLEGRLLRRRDSEPVL